MSPSMNDQADNWVRIGLALTLIVGASLLRLTPHLPNVTPIAAVALFSGFYLTGRWSWLVPIVALLSTDALIGWYELPVMASVYGSLALVGLLGYAVRAHRNPATVVGASVAGSLLFFVITNAAVWAWGHLYPLTAAGLVTSYVNAVPFLRNTLLGDVGYTVLLFGTYELVRVGVNHRLTSVS